MESGAYVYQAALLCIDCGDQIREKIDGARKANARNRRRFGNSPEHDVYRDSDDYPMGPYPDGGGEADSPQHCDHCGCFLENPLTSEGYKYVEEACREAMAAGRLDSVALTEWQSFYDIDLDDDDDLDDEIDPP